MLVTTELLNEPQLYLTHLTWEICSVPASTPVDKFIPSTKLKQTFFGVTAN